MALTWVSQRRDMLILMGMQVMVIILFAVFCRYSEDMGSPYTDEDSAADKALVATYPLFQDVHVMIFAGFGLLMTFLRRYAFSSSGFSMLVAALVVQWAVLCHGVLHMNPGHRVIPVSLHSLLSADLAAAAVLISMGAVLGKTSPLQLLVMGVLEVMVSTANEFIGQDVMQAPDAGASMYVHVFGAYFGLAVSLVLGHGSRVKAEGPGHEGSSYTSDMFAMIGTLFLWMFWPSFNAALTPLHDRDLAVTNTYLALTSCCVTAFVMSAIVSKESRFDMVHIQNATLAGGVAIGTSANLLVQPYGALLVGVAAGVVSVVGYRYIQPLLLQHVSVHDTCGVHNLHGMPGVLAGVVGALAAATYGGGDGNALSRNFPAMGAASNSTEGFLGDGGGRTAAQQAGYQLLALVTTLVVALVSGAVTGLIVKLPVCDIPPKERWFTDEHAWEVPEGAQDSCTSCHVNGRASDDDAKTETAFHEPRVHM